MGKKKERKEITLRLASFKASRYTIEIVCPMAPRSPQLARSLSLAI
jgi:hypothetical protein